MSAQQSRIERRLTASKRAGLLRVGFAVAALGFSNGVFPSWPSAHLMFAAYLLMSLGFQAMIVRGVAASELRSMTMGLIDTAVLSYAVYLLGPATSVMPFIYLLIPVVNAASSSSRSRVSMRLAAVGGVAYLGLLLACGSGLAPYAPALAGDHAPPPISYLMASGLLVVFSVLSTTSIVLKQMLALDRMNVRLAELSQLDELTGLCNRRQLISELRRQLDRVARGGSCGVLMLDLDGFKRVNDQLGHDAGDLLLMDIASALTAETRTVDLVARYGGDEFVVVLPDLTPEGAYPVAERIVTAVERVGRERFLEAPVTASVGLTVAVAQDDVAGLLRRADGQAYAAKRAGGNRVSMSILVSAAASGIVSTKPERRRSSRA